jgi:hypothetical protein
MDGRINVEKQVRGTPGRPGFCTVAPNIVSVIIGVLCLTYKNVYQLTCTEQKAPDVSEVHRSFQNCLSWVWNFPYVTLLAPRIWWWLLDFCNVLPCIKIYLKEIGWEAVYWILLPLDGNYRQAVPNFGGGGEFLD